MLKLVYNWIRYSGVWITLIGNPFHWRFSWELLKDDELNPKMNRFEMQLFFLNIRIVLDDGSW